MLPDPFLESGGAERRYRVQHYGYAHGLDQRSKIEVAESTQYAGEA